jgi:4-hydroxyphenylacetate 3-monooxygenase
MDTPGIKLICRPSYEFAAAATGSPWDYPLTSRFDENDAIFVFDNAFIPWENVIIHRDVERLKSFYPRSGFFNGFTLQGCTRLAVKLDFIIGLLYKAARATGVEAFRGVQAQIGEVIGWRNLFWSLSDAMAFNPEPWVNGAVLPNVRASSTYRLFMTEAYPAVRAIVEKVIASGLIYLPSHARDIKNPDISKYLARYVRGSNGIDYKERIKIMKMLWDAVGTEFGARHELYEMNYSGSHELVRIFPLQHAQASGALKEMEALAERCMADYDEDGWKHPTYRDGSDISVLDPPLLLFEFHTAAFATRSASRALRAITLSTRLQGLQNSSSRRPRPGILSMIPFWRSACQYVAVLMAITGFPSHISAAAARRTMLRLVPTWMIASTSPAPLSVISFSRSTSVATSAIAVQLLHSR